jgi:predicted SAM-dependent methyltransferase
VPAEQLPLPIEFTFHGNLKFAQPAFENDPRNPQLSFDFANALAASGQYPLAAEVFAATAALRAENGGESCFRRGLCLLLCDRFGEAAAVLEQVWKRIPAHHDLRVVLGICYFHLGLTARANTHWWAASRIRPTSSVDQFLNRFLTDEFHPERMALYPLCTGRGADVGCGNRKTHPDAVGVDLTPAGSNGEAGCVRGKVSVADVVASGDNMTMFADGSLDYIVQRHNLEHYQDFIKAIQEWKRIVRPGGLIGMVVPDDETCDTIRLDPTHKHVFTQSSLARALHLIGGLQVVHMAELLMNWSFLCIIQKREGLPPDSGKRFDYLRTLRRFENEQIVRQSRKFQANRQTAHAHQCTGYLHASTGGD